ncbi:MAG: DNA repair protein RadC [Burkholderiaceae bacterium]|nr:DNA repair protein RadC [Burkholderiaceae bacterium]MCD8517614.1 DNA repair protein RadC [Burkholderiaceae bacterium]MCD8537407.1 DNA repair protein RadC [Burkholderiaceae bacterium]MCD8565566.1 DNA repair protein RadC [Burkholderiaceae bacterium]
MHLRESLTPDERPRERLAKFGARALTDAELVALLLGSGRKGCNAIGMANELLASCGGLRGLQRKSVKDLKALKGLGPARASLLAACFEIGERASLSELVSGQPVRQPKQIHDHCRRLLSNRPIEHCIALLLNAQNQILACKHVSRGTLTQTSVYPRELVKMALEHHASAVILAHNHPSGFAEPSPGDISMTQTLGQALALVDVSLLDHIIVAGPRTISLFELGYMAGSPVASLPET